MTRRPLFLDSPLTWTRSGSRVTDAARDACAIERVERRTSGAATVVFAVVLAVLGAMLLVHFATPCAEGVLC